VRALLPASAKEKIRRPFAQVLQVAQANGCTCVVVEERYIDPDYRSEYSAFWSRRFEDRPALARRLHFFQGEIDPSQLSTAPTKAGYLGYSVLRPTQLGPVGGTILKPPRELDDGVLTSVLDRPSLFGNPLEVEGVPFCQQDGEFLVCAHTAAWLCHYVAQERGIIGRWVTADLAAIPSAEGSKHRPLPSTGLTGEQMQAVFSALGIPALFYDMNRLPKLPADLPLPSGRRRRRERHEEHDRRTERERILRVVCKYINSGFPVVVLTEGTDAHAFTLVGWQQAGDHIRLLACDDQVGPYEVIDDPLTASREHRAKWRSLMVPLPEKVFFTGEAAETRARNLPELTLARIDAAGLAPPDELTLLAESLHRLDGPISLRARLIEGRRYKTVAGRQERSAEVTKLIRLAHLPHWVWVVEMQDRAARERGEPCVLAEWIFDSTAHDDVPLERLASTRSATTDAHGRSRGHPRALWAAPGSGAMWRSLITDRELLHAEYP
jgi:hypothetical protein